MIIVVCNKIFCLINKLSTTFELIKMYGRVSIRPILKKINKMFLEFIFTAVFLNAITGII